jgi:hypothetical protein
LAGEFVPYPPASVPFHVISPQAPSRASQPLVGGFFVRHAPARPYRAMADAEMVAELLARIQTCTQHVV